MSEQETETWQSLASPLFLWPFILTKICFPTGDYDAPCPYPYTYTLRDLVSVGFLFLSIILKMVTARCTVTLEQLKTYMWPNPESQSCTYACTDFRHKTECWWQQNRWHINDFAIKTANLEWWGGVDISYLNSTTPQYSTNYKRCNSYSDLILKINHYLYAFLTHQIKGTM